MLNKKIVLKWFFFCLLTGLLKPSAGQVSSKLPDTLKGTSYLCILSPGNRTDQKTWTAGIFAGNTRLELFKFKKNTGIGFSIPKGATVLTTGVGVKVKGTRLEWPATIHPKGDYRLMISMAGDSAENFVLYSAYAYIPDSLKWKLIGTSKVPGFESSLQMVSNYWSGSPKDTSKPDFKEEWIQRANGKWINQRGENLPLPQVNLLGHTDSLSQSAIENNLIKQAIAEGRTDAVKEYKGIYYSIMNEGTGQQVKVTDSVLVHYKGYLFSDGKVFDQTTGTPRKFPLNRLITGWQIGVPLLKAGGKIKLVIPSHLAYSIRTRSAKIPPNSTLVFEIEVVEAIPVMK